MELRMTRKRISTSFTPSEIETMDEFRGSKTRAEWIRVAIQLMVSRPSTLRDQLVDIQLPALPDNGAPRVDVRGPAELFEQFDGWLGGVLTVGNALRSFVRWVVKAQEIVERTREAQAGPAGGGTRSTARRKATRRPTPGRPGNPGMRQQSGPAHPPGATPIGRQEAHESTTGLGSPYPSAAAIFKRHEQAGFDRWYGPQFLSIPGAFEHSNPSIARESSWDSRPSIEQRSADPSETTDLVRDLEHGEPIVVYRSFSRTEQKAFEAFISNVHYYTEVHFLIGAKTAVNRPATAAGDVEQDDLDALEDVDGIEEAEVTEAGAVARKGRKAALVGVRDPGEVADLAAAIIHEAGRGGTYEVVKHVGVPMKNGRFIHLVEVIGTVL